MAASRPVISRPSGRLGEAREWLLYPTSSLGKSSDEGALEDDGVHSDGPPKVLEGCAVFRTDLLPCCVHVNTGFSLLGNLSHPVTYLL